MEARATVIIPTYGHAKFARWAIKSVQNQTVHDIEICIVCDGSPAPMVSFFKDITKEDPRIKVFSFRKSARTGEPYRDIVIRQTSGQNIYYCCHDDLWLPHHIQELEQTLKTYPFANSIQLGPKLPEKFKDANKLSRWDYFNSTELVQWISCIDFRKHEIVSKMLWGEYFTGLTFGAHTRKSYFRLPEGWVTTPRKYIPTDVYMWYKFLLSNPKGFKVTRKVTALNFPKQPRRDWSDRERYEELKHYYEVLCDSNLLKQVNSTSINTLTPTIQLTTNKRIPRLGVIKICGAFTLEACKRNGFAVFLRKIMKFMLQQSRKAMMARYFCTIRMNRARKRR